ncbi:MAG: hypothetical protein J0I41_13670 [Filimonas sp.]|nr:hypothetical protein [Filimonas sp.]
MRLFINIVAYLIVSIYCLPTVLLFVLIQKVTKKIKAPEKQAKNCPARRNPLNSPLTAFVSESRLAQTAMDFTGVHVNFLNAAFLRPDVHEALFVFNINLFDCNLLCQKSINVFVCFSQETIVQKEAPAAEAAEAFSCYTPVKSCVEYLSVLKAVNVFDGCKSK